MRRSIFHKLSLSFLWVLLAISVAYSNNLNLGSSVKIVNVTSSVATLEVSLTWENSWRDSYNNDGVWLFFKYRTAASPWRSVLFPDQGRVTGSFTAIPGHSGGETVGFFLYRSVQGSGDVSTTFTIDWTYPSDLNRTMFESNEVFLMAQGIEMVYVPYGSFPLGDGTSNNSFCTSDGSSVEITSDAAVNLSALGTSDLHKLTPPYPTGYDGFYIMKYEVSQEQYVAFINALSRNEQLQLLPQLTGLSRGQYIFGDTDAPDCRNGIVVSVPMTESRAAVLDNNLHNDNTYGGQDDGRTLACNYMSINDLLGYMSWSGLRPMSEVEYEKSCRRLSPQDVIPGEYTWGTTALSTMTGVVSETSGWSDESPNDGWVNAEGRFGLHPGSGPVRCGAFASIASNRETAGATYSGVMEMSGNLGELCLNTTSAALSFDGGLHGSGEYYPGEWGNIPASGFGLRGGGFSSVRERLRVSDRTDIESGYFPSLSFRDSTVGFRGIRMLDRTELGFNPGKILLNNSAAVTVCSGAPFTIQGIEDGGSPVLSGLLVTYRWYVNGKEIPREEGSSLKFPVGLYNTSVKDSVCRFTRRVFCALGDLETAPVTVTIPGKLSLSLPAGEAQLRLSCGVTSPVTASRLSDTRFRWVNASSGKTIRDWSSATKSDTYSPLHKDFGYMGAVRKLRCVSDVNGCRDSVELPVTIESSCYLEVAPELLSMTSNTNGTVAVGTLCGPGTVSWYYKDNGGDEHLISSSTAASSSGSPSSYTASYQPKYTDFKNTIGLRKIVVRSSLGDNARCIDSREIQVDVKATLDPGRISGPSLACGNTEITINNDQIAGVDGMSGLTPVYSWYFNGSATPLVNENGPTLKYRLPGNNLNTAVSYTFIRKAMTGSPSLQSETGASYTVSVPGIPTATITAPSAVCDGQNLTLPSPAITWAGLTGTGTWTLNGVAVPSPVRYANNGQTLVYTVSNSCHASSTSNGVKITVNNKPTVGAIAVPSAVCAGNALPLPSAPGVTWNGLNGSVAWQLNGGGVPNPVQYSHNGQTLTYVATNGCGATASNGVRVTVNAKPMVGAIATPAAVCHGSALGLPSAPGVTWNGLNGSVAWQLNGGGVPNPVQAGHNGQTLTYVATNGCGTTVSNGINITVHAPVVTNGGSIYASKTNVYVNETFTLYSNAEASATCGFGITKYDWYRDGTYIGTGNSVNQTLGVGTYTFIRRAYVSTGAYGDSYAITVVVNNPPGGEIVYGNLVWTLADQGYSTWYDAPPICDRLGSGYRLPTEADINTLPLNSNPINLPLMQEGAYWGSAVVSGNGRAFRWKNSRLEKATFRRDGINAVRCVRNK